MDFYEIVDQVIDLLKKRGRVTYGAVKLQFGLEDNQVEVLKDELIYAQKTARDEENRVLVWAGDAEEGPEPIDPPDPQSVVEPSEPAQNTPSPIEPHTPDAERRQLTVMFCDLADSTKLSGQLDPEDLRDVIRSYQASCTKVIQRYDGYVAQLLGDGLLVYFGYPQAHEDDAQRAIHAGLDMLDAMDTLNQRLHREQGVQLAVRVGIHTGLVVVGEMGNEGRQEQLALGATPNIAARLEGIASSNTVVISHATYRLVESAFDCEDLGRQPLKGIPDPLRAHRVYRERGRHRHLESSEDRGFAPLVGRTSEEALLLDRWAQAKDGMGQVVFLSGEAGLGKSRLAQAYTQDLDEKYR